MQMAIWQNLNIFFCHINHWFAYNLWTFLKNLTFRYTFLSAQSRRTLANFKIQVLERNPIDNFVFKIYPFFRNVDFHIFSPISLRVNTASNLVTFQCSKQLFLRDRNCNAYYSTYFESQNRDASHSLRILKHVKKCV